MENSIKENECISFIIKFNTQKEFNTFINKCYQYQIKLDSNVKYDHGPIICDYGILTCDNHFYSDIYIRRTTPSIAACSRLKINAKDIISSKVFKDIFVNHNRSLLDELFY